MGKTVVINGAPVGDGHPCFIVAEAGINHNGDPEIAKRLITTAALCGASAVKFQKRSTKDILVREALERLYESPHAYATTYGEHRDKLELSEAAWRELATHARGAGISFFASPWDQKSADFLESLGVPAYKIASAAVTNLPLLAYIAKKGKPVIMSTGMSTMEEIDDGVRTVLRHNPDLVLLHCVSNYPCENHQVNLRMMQTLRARYDVPVGYSGHEPGVAVSVAARTLGAALIEKHFTLNRAWKGSDHAASLEPDGLSRVVRYVRTVDAALGDGVKRINEDELKTRAKLAKSIATAVTIPKGAVITAYMLTMKGPGTGLTARHLPAIIGKTAATDIAADTIVPKDALEWA